MSGAGSTQEPAREVRIIVPAHSEAKPPTFVRGKLMGWEGRYALAEVPSDWGRQVLRVGPEMLAGGEHHV